MITLPRTLATLCFEVKGAAPSKSNFRFSRKAGRESWRRIKAYEESVGYAALAAMKEQGGVSEFRKYRFHPARVEVAAFNQQQRADLDNIFKSLLDGMEGVCMERDNQVVSCEAARIVDDFGARVRVRVMFLDVPDGESA